MDGATLNGIIVIDKPPNVTSARAVASVKKALNAAKVGHAGTLDPFAEGVLVCCVNQATRLAGFLLHSPKRYVAVLKLGEETDTQDCTGTVVATSKPNGLSQQTIQNAIKAFKGAVEQLPPVYSALKHKGVPLYRLARRGQPVQKPPRRVQIYDIKATRIELPFIHFEVVCSAGTYIRTLGADIGKSLGCGGHLHALKRVESSGFKLDQATPLSALKEMARSRKLTQRIISMRDALPAMPEFSAADRLVEKIRHGQILTVQDLSGPHRSQDIGDAYVKIVDQKGNLIAIVERSASGNRLKYCCVLAEQNA
ncbi:MAG: tRNA pseudouridine(55) synthase TruB [Desulfobacterales bacterium]|nr:MAG: tRNA pseudouridine(55) synthase TruB [Desulfobacterales bacterium]